MGEGTAIVHNKQYGESYGESYGWYGPDGVPPRWRAPVRLGGPLPGATFTSPGHHTRSASGNRRKEQKWLLLICSDKQHLEAM